jgi:hypothetical protein
VESPAPPKLFRKRARHKGCQKKGWLGFSVDDCDLASFGKRELQNLAWPVQGLWSLGLNLGLTVQCSAQLPLLCYQETADNRGSCRGLQLPSYRVLEVNTSKNFLSRGSLEARVPRGRKPVANVWKTVL